MLFFFLHKYKDGISQQLYHFTIHVRCHKNELESVEKYFFNKCANTQQHSVLREEHATIKEREKHKFEAIRHLYSVKNK